MRKFETEAEIYIEMTESEYVLLGQYLYDYLRIDQGKHCFYCGIKLTHKTKTRDHVIPKCYGGEFVVSCCLSCNNAKGDLLPDEFRTLLYNSKEVEFYGETIIRLRKEKSCLLSTESMTQ